MGKSRSVISSLKKDRAFVIDEDITNNPKVHYLGDDGFLMFFPYELVNPLYCAMAMRDAGIGMDKYEIVIMYETPATAYQKRLDSPRMEERFPKVVSFARDVLKLELGLYLYVRIQGRAKPLVEKKEKRGSNFTKKKKRRKK